MNKNKNKKKKEKPDKSHIASNAKKINVTRGSQFLLLNKENHIGKKYNFQCSYFYIIIDIAF